MSTTTVPLTLSQKARLALRCLPFPFFAAALAVYYRFWIEFAGSVTGQPIDPGSGKSMLFAAFMALVLAFTARAAVHAVRDLASGVAVVTEDRLVRRWGSGRYKGATFEKLGRVRLMRWSGAQGSQHRVVYSPASKIAWEAVEL